MPTALLTVAGVVPDDLDDQVARERRPRADYREIARRLNAELIDQSAASERSGVIGRVLRRVAGPDALVAAACWRRRKDVDIVFTDSERVGFPYAVFCALLRRRPTHVMIAHRLSGRWKQRAHRWLRLQRRIDHVLVYASSQRQVALDLGYRPDQITVTPFMVDTAFWDPQRITSRPTPRPVVAAVGQELRDYPTLVEAARGMELDVTIAAASPWSRRADSSAGLDLPDNVTVVALDLFDLRQLYADASIVAVPVVETDFQAGITSILEGMSMARPLICTKTSGQTDTVVDGHTGLYVAPGDAAGLRGALQRLVDHPDEADRMAADGRAWVGANADIEVYAARLAEIARRVDADRRARR
ncbi:MAG: glycosyltransferase family 4 protein [Desertimonas sp.]